MSSSRFCLLCQLTMVLRFCCCVVEVLSSKVTASLPLRCRIWATLETTLRASLTSSSPQPCGPTAPRTYFPCPLLMAIFMDRFLQGWGEEERPFGALIDQLVDQIVLRGITGSGAHVKFMRCIGRSADENHVHHYESQRDRLGF